MFYALGLGPMPTNAHAALIGRLHETSPQSFDLEGAVAHWVEASGNSPLLHTAAMANFYDGVYVLLTEFKVKVDERDVINHVCGGGDLTALHIAAWEGNVAIAQLLIHHGANVRLKDSWGRTPLHYASIRGFAAVATALLTATATVSLPSRGSHPPKRVKMKVDPVAYLAMLDDDGRTAADIAATLCPPMTELVDVLTNYSTASPIHHSNCTTLNQTNSSTSVLYFSISKDGDTSSSDESKNVIQANENSVYVVERKSANELTPAAFHCDYVRTQRPLLIQGQTTTGDDIWAYLDRDAFSDRFGDIELEGGEALHIREQEVPDYSQVNPFAFSPLKTKRMPLRDWIVNLELFSGSGGNGSAQTNWPSFPWEAVHHNVVKDQPLFANDVKIPSFFRHCFRHPSRGRDQQNGSDTLTIQQWSDADLVQINRHAGFKLTMGPANSGYPMRGTNSSWHLLLSGVKEWYLLPPGHGHHAIGYQHNTTSRRNASAFAAPKVMPVSEWIEEVYPALSSRGLVTKVIQHPGEILYIPHHWACASINRKDAVLVSQEICSFRHSELRYAPLMESLYGQDITNLDLAEELVEDRSDPDLITSRDYSVLEMLDEARQRPRMENLKIRHIQQKKAEGYKKSLQGSVPDFG